MPITEAESRNINAQTQIPSRSAAIAGNVGKVPSAINVLNINAEFAQVGAAGSNTPAVINHTSTEYVLAVSTNSAAQVLAVLPAATSKIGDRARVYTVDATGQVSGYAEYFFTGAAWQAV